MSDPPDPKPPLPEVNKVQLEITWRSIFRLILGVILSYAAILLWPIFKILVLSILLAIALYPIVRWGSRKGWPEWVGYLLASAVLFVIVAGCLAIAIPMLAGQISTLGESLPKLREQIIAQLPPTGFLRQALQTSMDSGTVADSRLVLERLLALLGTTLGGFVHLVIVMALAVYLLIDGPRALRWLIAFFPLSLRGRIAETLSEVSQLISAYLAGQFLVSILAAAYVSIVLALLGVPAPFLLGVIAGICDVLPVVGFFVAVFLAMVMGWTVSPTTAALIFVLYGAYHLFENLFILPKVYGEKLRIPGLAVPLGIAAGALVAGLVGAIIVLPIIAAYPVIERLWLAPKLSPDTLSAHTQQSRSRAVPK